MDAATLDMAVNAALAAAVAFLMWKLAALVTGQATKPGRAGNTPPAAVKDGAVFTLEEVQSGGTPCLPACLPACRARARRGWRR